MENKYKLKQKNKMIFIENHMTKEEKKIQFELRNTGRDTRNKKDAKIKIG